MQPVDPIDEWTYPPFDMTMDSNLEGYGAVVTGRGAADNKGNSVRGLGHRPDARPLTCGKFNPLTLSIPRRRSGPPSPR